MEEKKTKFTYILGAGASFNSLPVVKDFGDKVYNIFMNVRSRVGSPGFGLNKEEIDEFWKITNDLNYLHEVAKTHHTIDTYARKLYLQLEFEELYRLKFALSIYFKLAQAYKPVDMRYDAFFASILKRKDNRLKLPDNINVLSWNYDYQMELSAGKFSKYKDVDEVESFLTIYPRKQYGHRTEGFSLFKLNGSACSYVSEFNVFDRSIFTSNYKLVKLSDGSNIMHSSITNESEVELFRDVIKYHKDFDKNKAKESLHFAWEDDPIPKQVRELALKATQDTEILVVIGYSFPVYNREVDRELFKNMKKLKKIYLQIPEKDIEGVIQRFKAIRPLGAINTGYNNINIEPIVNTEEFFIPYEF